MKIYYTKLDLKRKREKFVVMAHVLQNIEIGDLKLFFAP